ncbi:MAG: type II toxin-antitoxin system RelE/ParE family toxin [Candidatus Portnoybacteria bacterium CG_4_9_14_3_um_filter_43_11]|uniref:Type II toxin-antitoxin system RelE/ParE family toxin n=1 Tax=Candidatus Portnoybacteria bacterium CG_4_9_14_3_um_filter_43_11 TaxID=1974805 RepID=A0A2M7YLT9_9BACT|nr:MAG: type II toxin-antitoxin system RelE/ParE family toxin [Candidatus Portnoybacteria bacterium CG_4_9_14_3_um_filter_43_11]
MDKISKALKKFSDKERKWVKEILRKLKESKVEGLETKKLKDRDDIYRVRKGNIRIIYRIRNKRVTLLAAERRSDNTYKKNRR